MDDLDFKTAKSSSVIFTVDGDEYSLFDFSHFSDKDELKFNQMSDREKRWQRRIKKIKEENELEDDETKAEENDRLIEDLEKKLQEQRVELVMMVSNVPISVAQKLPTYSKVKIIDGAVELSRSRLGNKKEEKNGDES